MAIKLTAKEKMFLQEQKAQEELCVQKYQTYNSQAQDPQLKQLFSQLAQKEQEHLNTINQILNGEMPVMQQSSQSSQGSMSAQTGTQSSQGSMGTQTGTQSSQSSMGTQTGTQTSQNSMSAQSGSQSTSGTMQQNQGQSTSMSGDKELCVDMLSTEKYVSGNYDTAIFECTDTNIRNTLNHIQKEEQEHGKQIFDYMQSKGMYNPQ